MIPKLWVVKLSSTSLSPNSRAAEAAVLKRGVLAAEVAEEVDTKRVALTVVTVVAVSTEIIKTQTG
jgi:hypothetical protein